jgi:ribosomal protein S18 acetylase RimI-like enzyme
VSPRRRWHRPGTGELPTIERWLSNRPDPQLGPARHMFALACLDSLGPDVARVATEGDRWAVCIVHPGRTLVPAGDPGLLGELGVPTSRWRMIIGDVAACEPLIADDVRPGGALVHHQRFMLLDPERLVGTDELADPGMRPAVPADAERLVELSVRLHTDDEFGDHVSRAARRSYQARTTGSIESGLLRVVGPEGAPIAKLERSVASTRRGIQLAGIIVAPEARNRGIGRALVAAAAREAIRQVPGRPISLHVRAANAAAIHAYRAAGFVDVEEWRLVVRS